MLEIVDVIKVDVVQAVDFRIDVAGYGNVDEKERAVAPGLEDRTDCVGGNHDIRCSGRGNDDIRLCQERFDFGQ